MESIARNYGQAGANPEAVSSDPITNPDKESNSKNKKYTIKRMLHMSYQEQMEALYRHDRSRLKSTNSICVMKTAPVLQKYGFTDYPVALLQSNLCKITRESVNSRNKSTHSIPFTFIERLPDYINNPALVMTEQDRVTLFTDWFVENRNSGEKEPVIIGLQANSRADLYHTHAIKSIYGLRDIETYLRGKTADGAESFVEDREKAENLLSKAGLQLPGRQQILNLPSNVVNSSQRNVKDSSYETTEKAEKNGEKNRTDTWLKFTRLQLPVNNNQYDPIDIISNSNENSNNGTRKYSLNPEFVRQYDAWDEKRGGVRFEIGNTSKALKSIEINDKAIVWDSGKL